MVAPAIEYSAAALMRRLADNEERQALALGEADFEQAEALLSRVAIARARADILDHTEAGEMTSAQRGEWQTVVRDYTIGQDIADKMHEFAERMNQGEVITWDDLRNVFEQAGEAHGVEYGLPMPSIDYNDQVREVVLARGIPLRERLAAESIEYAIELRAQGLSVRNSWQRLGDLSCSIIDTSKGPRLLMKPMAGFRMRKWFDGLAARADSHLSADAELRALESLRKKINKKQFDTYMLSGSFGERSPRSDLHYFFRKGLPTLAMSWHGENSNGGRVIAALCFHPMGYVWGTHAGLMTPTDEVIAALLWMRADEHGLWKKSGQWHASDTRSGL